MAPHDRLPAELQFHSDRQIRGVTYFLASQPPAIRGVIVRLDCFGNDLSGRARSADDQPLIRTQPGDWIYWKGRRELVVEVQLHRPSAIRGSG